MEHRDDQEVRTEDVTEQPEQATEAPAEPEPEAPAGAGSQPSTATATVEPAESTTGESIETPRDTLSDTVEPLTEERVALLVAEARERYNGRWKDVQTGFVDGPRQAVQQADQLVAEIIEHLAQSFMGERRRLEEQWSRGDVDTEQLRVAFQGYRMLFSGLLED